MNVLNQAVKAIQCSVYDSNQFDLHVCAAFQFVYFDYVNKTLDLCLGKNNFDYSQFSEIFCSRIARIWIIFK